MCYNLLKGVAGIISVRRMDLEPVNVCVVGVGGFGREHVRRLRVLEEEKLARFSAVVIRSPQKYAEEVAHYKKRNVPIYGSFEEMLEQEQGRTEIVTLPVGIPYHAEMTIAALKKGYNVIVEKPTTAIIQEVDAMLEAERKSGKFCVVAFQRQSRSNVKMLKKKICDGDLGEIENVAVNRIEKRSNLYYERNSWAGKFRYNGRYVLDGTIGNPFAHQLMLSLYYGTMEEGAANPVRVRAELYKGHSIEGEDTSAVIADVDSEAKIYFFGTLCANIRTSALEIVGSKATAKQTSEGMRIEYKDGKKELLKSAGLNSGAECFRNPVRYLREEEERLDCPLSMTRPYVLALNGAWESSGGVKQIPDTFLDIREEPTRIKYLPDQPDTEIATYIKGIEKTVEKAYEERKLYSELGVNWAVPTKYFSVSDYSHFTGKMKQTGSTDIV
ncbi:MAG: Gfo/Idh/MocA family oxidoreductase [Candidatus Bathyarchaeota archaeon]|nr:Gfo/Idh/MocA family oxidoreductase [Candidatus Bathyarchaeota archaeon]